MMLRMIRKLVKKSEEAENSLKSMEMEKIADTLTEEEPKTQEVIRPAANGIPKATSKKGLSS